MIHRWTFLGFWVLPVFLFGVQQTEPVLVRFPEKVLVVGPRVALGQIAEISGNEKIWVEKMRRLDLVKAPPPGRGFLVTRALVKRSLIKEGLPVEKVRFEGSEGVQVETKSQTFSIDSLLPQIRDFVLNGLEESPEHVEVKLSSPGKDMLLPGGKVRANIRPPLSGRYEGLLLLTVEVEVEGRLVRTLPVRVEVEVFRKVVVSKAKVEKGQRFKREDLELTRRPASQIPAGALTDLEGVSGRTASVALLPGSILRVQSLYDPPAIRQGEMVRAVVVRGNVEITVDVKAVDNGKVGDWIRVENTKTKKILRARVMNEKLVSVEEKGK